MRRRTFVFAVGVATIAPGLSRAQKPPSITIGYLSASSQEAEAEGLAVFRNGLERSGYVVGRNIAIEYRWAAGRYDRLPAMATDLVQHRCALIVATGGSAAALALKAATSVLPVVFVIGTDPIASGVVASLSRPEGNLTGVTSYSHDLSEKRVEIIRDLVPSAKRIALLVNRTNAMAEPAVRHLVMKASMNGPKLDLVNASTDGELIDAFAGFNSTRTAAIVVFADPFFTTRRELIVEMAARYGLPSIYDSREFAAAGGLISYGTSPTYGHRRAAIYASRILQGARPSDLPVERPAAFELVINLKTVKTLGVTIPPSILARADEVIE